MNNIPNVTISLDPAEQNLLLDAIGFAEKVGGEENVFSKLECAQLLLLHNLIVQARVEQDPDFEPA